MISTPTKPKTKPQTKPSNKPKTKPSNKPANKPKTKTAGKLVSKTGNEEKTRYVYTYNIIVLNPKNEYNGRITEIKSRTKMKVWDGQQKNWMTKTKPDGSNTVRLDEVTYQNIMLSQMHPDYEFSVCAIPKDSKLESQELLDDYENFSLDLAGGARKHGHFVFTRHIERPGTVGQFYFPEEKRNMGRINYGSISLSECKALFQLKDAKILVVADPELENNRPGKNYNNPWKVGDAHGKINEELLKVLLEGIIKTETEKTPVQFRLGIAGNEQKKGIWGKGTVAPIPAKDMQGYDLVLPESCFKTYKPSLGNNVFEIVNIAALGEAQEREAKGGTQIWTWFPIDIIEKEIMPGIRKECEKILETIDSKDVYKLIKLFRPIKEADENSELPDLVDKWFDDLILTWTNGNPEDPTDDDSDAHVPTLSLILENDQGKILERHPYVISSIKRSLKKRWTRLAINGAIRFSSYMAMPDDSLSDLTFSCKHLKTTEHITFRYPVRHWGDIQLWHNVGNGNGYNGVFFVSHVTFGGTGELNQEPYGQGGDFDGDYGNAIDSKKLPLISQRIKEWNDVNSPNYRKHPKLVKAPKSPIQDTLKQVALRSMDNLTGLVASQIMHAEAKGLSNIVIPDGSGRTVLEVLSQALQDEVDRFKNDLARDTKALSLVAEILTKGAPRPIWQSDYKSPAAYLNRPMKVGAEGEDDDTISYMIRQVNDYWKDAELPSPLGLGESKFRNLFGTNPIANGLVTQQQLDFARAGQLNYYKKLAEAIAASRISDDSIRKLMRDLKTQRQNLEEGLKARYSPVEASAKLWSWATAYWWVAHNERAGNSNSHPMGKAGLPFLLFPDIIAEQLSQMRYDFRIIALKYQKPPRIADEVPITQPREVILIGTYTLENRNISVLDPDNKGRVVMVNKLGWIALKLKYNNFVDNDNKIYASIKNSNIIDSKGNLVLDRLLEPGEYIYLKPDGSLQNRFETPHARMKKETKETDSVLIKILKNKTWINAGLTTVEDKGSIEIGQVLDATIISYKSERGGWSANTISVTVTGKSRKWFAIYPYQPQFIPNYGEYHDIRLYSQSTSFPFGTRDVVYADFGNGFLSVGVLALHCDAIPKGRTIRCHILFRPHLNEILFSPS